MREWKMKRIYAVFCLAFFSSLLTAQNYTERDKAAMYWSAGECKKVMQEITDLYSGTVAAYHFYKAGQIEVKNHLLINIDRYDRIFYEFYLDLFKFASYFDDLENSARPNEPWNEKQLTAFYYFLSEEKSACGAASSFSVSSSTFSGLMACRQRLVSKSGQRLIQSAYMHMQLRHPPARRFMLPS